MMQPTPALALAALSMSGNVGRAMYPAFDADTLHYAAGCSDADAATVDSLTLTMSTESSDTRLAVNGIQVANSNALVPLRGLDGTSDIVIVLSNAAGQARTYTVHCLDHDYPTITVTKQPGAWDGLILGAVETVSRSDAYHWSLLQIVDTNGVPWFRQRLEDFRVAHFRPLRGASYAYGYTRSPGPEILQMLDENLEEAGPAIGPPNSAGRDESIDLHDFAAKADDNIVMVTYDPSTRDLSAFTDERRQSIQHQRGGERRDHPGSHSGGRQRVHLEHQGPHGACRLHPAPLHGLRGRVLPLQLDRGSSTGTCWFRSGAAPRWS